jgi:tetratricopeptide (TPR) repeat protein
MTRAADIKFSLQKDNVTAARWLNEALKKYGDGQDLTETVGQLSRIWLAYKYKATFDLSGKPDDIDRMYANLMKNMNWLDSNLVRLEKEMGTPPNIDKVRAEQYIQIAESYSTLVETGSFEKFADLNMKAASLARKTGEQGKAIQLYHRTVEKLPSWHPAGPAALTEQAHIYKEDMRDLEKAKESYRELLRLYPKNPEFAPAAEAALKSLEATK